MRTRQRFSARQLDEQVRTIRVVAVIGLGVAMAIAAAWLASVDLAADAVPTRPAVARPADPLRAESERCNRLGRAALDDDACARAWAEHRRRFFAGDR